MEGGAKKETIFSVFWKLRVLTTWRGKYLKITEGNRKEEQKSKYTTPLKKAPDYGRRKNGNKERRQEVVENDRGHE